MEVGPVVQEKSIGLLDTFGPMFDVELALKNVISFEFVTTVRNFLPMFEIGFASEFELKFSHHIVNSR